MADAPASQRSLWLQLLWRTEFRSRRERVVNSIYAGAIAFLVIFPTAHFEWFDSLLLRFLWIVFGIVVLHTAGWAIWLFWGRKWFPLPAPDESRSTD